MRLQSFLSALTSGVLVALQGQGVTAGSLSLVQGAELFTFEYFTSEPHLTNWIGIYHAYGGGPVNEVYDEPSLLWKYVPETTATVHIPASSLEPGTYKAFFLAQDGYKWLAEPLNITMPGDPDAPLSFFVNEATLHNARQGDEFTYSVRGLIKDPNDSTIFTKRSCGPDWLKVSADGVLSGTPGPNATDAQVLVRASSGGSFATIKLTIPVRPEGAPLVEKLRVMSFNMWNGGANVNNHHEKQVRFLVDSNVDVIGLQEDTGGRSSRLLAEALGWHVWASISTRSVSVLSRYPIVEAYGAINASGGVRIALDGEDQQLNFFVVHLGYTPYGPYDFCFDNMTVDRVIQREAQSGRTPQITDTLAGMAKQLAETDEIPVMLVGDFNAPSHLDWIEDLKEKNCGYWGVPWPTSVKPIEAGLIDSFRVANPDPVATPGITWSPIYLTNNGRPEPLDRIDFIYHKGDLKVLASETVVVGNPRPMPNHQDNEHTTDHSIVVTDYDLRV